MKSLNRRTGFDIDRLIAILVNHHAVSEQEGKALKIGFERSTNENFDDFLLEEGLVDREDLLKALSFYFQVPAFDVTGYFFDHELLLKFPKDFLLRNEIIPLEQDEQTLVMVASNPNDEDLLAAIGKFVSYDIQFRVGIALDITDAVSEFYDKAVTVLNDPDRVERQRQEVIHFLEHEGSDTDKMIEEDIERIDQ